MENRYYHSEKFNFYLVGPSRDLRTNVWSITCKSCSKKHSPRTTRLNVDVITCPKCNISEIINYNNLNTSNDGTIHP